MSNSTSSTVAMTRLTASVLLAILSLCAGISYAGWTGGAGTQATGASPCNAGQVLGTVGELQAFNTTGGGLSLNSTGSVGANWNGQQFQRKISAQVSKSNDCTHTYHRQSAGAATLIINSTAAVTSTGSANQLNPGSPGWWWDTWAVTTDTGPVTQTWTPSGGWQGQFPTWSQNTGVYAGGGDDGVNAGTGNPSNNNPLTVPPSSVNSQYVGNSNGVMSGSLGLPDVIGAKVQCAYLLHSHGRADVDNAIVSNSKLELVFTFATNIQ